MNQLQLERECRTYARYLIGELPDEYVIRKYIECHAIVSRLTVFTDPFDRFLTTISAQGPFRAMLADAYASRFRKYSMLRKKLVLTLALLESSPRTFEEVDAVGPGGLRGALVRLAGYAARYVAVLALAIVLFLPVQLWTMLTTKRTQAPVVTD